MPHPFIARRMNRLFAANPTEQLPDAYVDYADTAIKGLHAALRAQTKPSYQKPKHPVDGWGLTATPLEQRGEIAGVPVISLLGCRAIYLSTEPDVVLRVLSTPHPQRFLEERTVQIRRTTIPKLLAEDASLYHGLLNAAESWVTDHGLDYQLPEPPEPTITRGQ